MSLILSIALYILSFTPLWLTVLFEDVISIIDGGNIYTEIISIVCMAVGVLSSVLVVHYQFKYANNRAPEVYTLEEVKECKTITAEFLLSYILPLFAFEFTQWKGVAEFLIFFLVLGYLCVRHNYFSVNIILEIMHYTMYECTLSNSDGKKIKRIVLCRGELKVSKGKELRTYPINNDIVLKIS